MAEFQRNTPRKLSKLRRSLDDIDVTNFSADVMVEIHACNTANVSDTIPTNFCKELSKKLYDAGKIFSVVIGHATKSNPRINYTNNVLEQDYRHGLRVVYHNGQELYRTRDKGRITFLRIVEMVNNYRLPVTGNVQAGKTKISN